MCILTSTGRENWRTFRDVIEYEVHDSEREWWRKWLREPSVAGESHRIRRMEIQPDLASRLTSLATWRLNSRPHSETNRLLYEGGVSMDTVQVIKSYLPRTYRNCSLRIQLCSLRKTSFDQICLWQCLNETWIQNQTGIFRRYLVEQWREFHRRSLRRTIRDHHCKWHRKISVIKEAVRVRGTVKTCRTGLASWSWSWKEHRLRSVTVSIGIGRHFTAEGQHRNLDGMSSLQKRSLNICLRQKPKKERWNGRHYAETIRRGHTNFCSMIRIITVFISVGRDASF